MTTFTGSRYELRATRPTASRSLPSTSAAASFAPLLRADLAINEVTRDPMTPMTNTPMLTIQHQAGSAPEPIAAISADAMMPMTPMMVATKKTICAALASDHQPGRSEEHTTELQSRGHLVCRLLLEKKNT